MSKSRPVKIVVADSNRELSELIERLQRQTGYQVAYCAFNAEAFKCIKEQAPDLVVLNMTEDNTPGLTLLSVIRSDAALSSIPIVVCATARPEVTQLINQLALMRLYVITSPSDVDQIMTKIKEALA